MTSQRDLSHLAPEAAEIAGAGAKTRIRWLYAGRWIGYPAANAALRKLESLIERPRTHRMPGMLLLGHTNNGKTTIALRFRELHPPDDAPKDDTVQVPVIYMEMPSRPDENWFFESILEQLYAAYRPRDPVQWKERQVRTLLKNLGVRMLIIDEIHNVLSGRPEQQRGFLYMLKTLSNKLQIPLVGVGIVDAQRAIQSDPQLANRFIPFVLERWRLNREFRRLLASYEQVLPLREPSKLTEKPIATKLMAMTEGLIGELSELLNLAAATAIEEGQERISEGLLDSLVWYPPSERRRRAASALAD